MLIAVLLVVFLVILWHHPSLRDYAPPSVPVPIANMDVYVINLDKATKRLDHFKKQFEQSDLSHGRSPIRVSAVDGRTIDLKGVVSARAQKEILLAEKTGFRQKHYELSRGAVGCYLSHIHTWQSLLKSDKHVALILEDDALLYPHMIQYLTQEVKTVPDDWDILLLGYECLRCQKDETLGPVHRVYKFFGLHGYMINQKAIKKITQSPRLRPIRKQIDTVLSDMAQKGELTIYATKRKLVEQNNRQFGTQIQLPINMETTDDVWSSYEE
jgi:GR25 family glycosyltransferase involved in LPS biosynthesis